jgi:outer membrane immunogenic protein
MNITSTKISKRLILATLTFMIAATISLQAQQGQTVSSVGSSQPDSDNFLNEKVVKKSSFDVKADKAEAPAAPALVPYNWTGGYIGGHLGYGWGKGDTRFEPLPSAATFINLQPQTVRVRPRGIFGGGQLGYNWQFGSVVVGGEGSLSVANIKKTVIVNPIIQNNGTPFAGAGFLAAGQKVKWLGSVRPRLGAAFGKVLVYGTAGFAYARIDYAATTDFRPVGTTQYPAAFSKTRKGWTAGGGVEIAVGGNWSVKGEYLYYDLGNTTFIANPTPALPPFQVQYTWQTKLHTFSGGVNFHF